MADQASTLRVGVIGCGHCGPNHIRVFSQIERSEVIACADTNPVNLERVKRRFPRIAMATTNYHVLLNNDNVDAVVIATDKGHEHVSRCRPFVEAGLPVFVDKPLVDQAPDRNTHLAALSLPF